MSKKIYISIPTWDSGTWTYTKFYSKEEFREFILGLFKEPGKYAFNSVSDQFDIHAQLFRKKGLYCEATEGTRDFQMFWDIEKEKCRKGVIYKDSTGTWYLTRELYFWWNFLKIPDKVKKTEVFPEPWDVHYHIALYNLLSKLHDKHSAILKKRQIGSSLYHMAMLINLFWFEKSQVIKMGASAKDYINNDKGSWTILELYRNHLNQHTGWFRAMNPDKSASMSWQQRLEVKENGRSSFEGNFSKITGTSFEKNPTAGVGGATRLFFHEEAGIAPKMSETYEFMRPALKMGGILTGHFIAAGSVGDLDHCIPLKSMILDPGSNDIYAVETTLKSEKGSIEKTGLFIPEQWGRPPFIDEYGNSLVEEAIEDIMRERFIWRYGDKEKDIKPVDPSLLQIRISQQPINIEEAFAIRKVALFNTTRIKEQLNRISDNEYKLEYVDLERTSFGTVTTKPSKNLPVPYDVKMTASDKTGCVVIHEHPVPGAKPLRTYLASVDPVAGDKTTTSESLASIYIYMMPTIRTVKHPDGNIETFTAGGKLVAWWTGRFDDINKTNEQLSMLVEYYQAFATCEYNVGSWANYMVGKNRTKNLAVKEDMIFDKEADIRQSSNNRYGWYNTPQVWKKMLEYGINSVTEELRTITEEEQEHIRYGVERIPDEYLLREMQDYQIGDGKNYDRLIAYCALVAFADLRLTTMSSLYTDLSLDNRSDTAKATDSKESLRIFKENMDPFKRLLGMTEQPDNAGYTSYKNIRRNPFKHLK